MKDDGQLLRTFVEESSEPAFAELLSRHLGLVYHAAARQLGDDAHLASDVAQQVFIALLGKARGLVRHPSIAGWLHTTTYYKVQEMRRAEIRRRARESLVDMNDDSAHDLEWQGIQPVLDEALRELSELDREAVLLRFFEGRGFPEIAATLSVGETAARKRVERALERLRHVLEARGVRSTAAAFSSILGAHAASAAPSGLAATITSAAVGVQVPATALCTLSLMSISKTSAASLAAMTLAAGFATYELSQSIELLSQPYATVAIRPDVETKASPRSPRPPATAPTPKTTNLAAEGLGLPDGNSLLRRHPQFREALFEDMRVDFREQYGALLERWDLTPEETERFFAIEMASHSRIVGRHIVELGEPVLSYKERHDELRQLLGQARYDEYLDFSKNEGPLRAVVTRVAGDVFYTSEPLTAAQSEMLFALLKRNTTNTPGRTRIDWSAVVHSAAGRFSPGVSAVLRELMESDRFQDMQSAAVTAAGKK